MTVKLAQTAASGSTTRSAFVSRAATACREPARQLGESKKGLGRGKRLGEEKGVPTSVLPPGADHASCLAASGMIRARARKCRLHPPPPTPRKPPSTRGWGDYGTIAQQRAEARDMVLSLKASQLRRAKGLGMWRPPPPHTKPPESLGREWREPLPPGALRSLRSWGAS